MKFYQVLPQDQVIIVETLDEFTAWNYSLNLLPLVLRLFQPVLDLLQLLVELQTF
jgi:hypothetical protein